ncbi:MAG TPA: hypothetical protein PKW21_00175 [Rhabdaerophilum sp.]|nr:hypothetical protein [Rhabdaerophilum sp.]
MRPSRRSIQPSNRKPRDPLFALLAINGIAGTLLGVLFVASAIWLDIGHLRHLVSFDTDGLIAIGLLTAGSIITFGSVVMGGAIMMLGRKEQDPDEDRGRGDAIPALAVVPARRAGK